MNTTTTARDKIFEVMKADFGYKNIMQSPRVQKIVVSVGVGKVNKDKKRLELIVDRLAKITGQAPAARAAKKAIANFKSRKGDVVGYQVTLRGARAKAFLDKLIHIVFPRTKDFRGISPGAIDEMGNITIGIKEHIVFPETSDEDSKDIFGLAITVATTAKNKKEAESFLRHIGVPLREATDKK
ncbi:50S ribosomal protein L5 [Candidatus Kaiserbacteria bacterium RIFCSPLOWO2_01_FULL_54_13]|uniref:Large ribosomal subunit protein uL5 n=1 Tax=Candidatus Kaiserbacteria bacterium RIFCSPLOWO2_01_FULL_54_13 TaxID=1798512 RepID=A0A1F6F371_9BACT|nr:MAG: 50S ribosomal protein L5 [Candidatus Kaiserbacteria bacterium RIFCSPLOWO2_01_FULL_54_13]